MRDQARTYFVPTAGLINCMHRANSTPITYFADQTAAAGAMATGWVATGLNLQGRPIQRSK